MFILEMAPLSPVYRTCLGAWREAAQLDDEILHQEVAVRGLKKTLCYNEVQDEV